MVLGSIPVAVTVLFFQEIDLTLKIQTYSEIILKQSFFKKAHVEFQLSLLGQMKLMLKEYVIQIGVSSK